MLPLAVVSLLAASCALIFGEGRAAVFSENALSIAVGDASDWSDRALANSGSCYSNLTKIYIDENNRVNTNVFRTYTLCPNTVFTPGVDDGSGNIVGGQQPIYPRANTLYKCGDSGDSSNRCILRGGDYGSFHGTTYPEPLVNATIQGITFESQNLFAVAIAAGGQISFVDCIIRDMLNAAPIILNLGSSRRRLTQLPTVQSKTPSDRMLAAVNYTNVLDVTFADCIFRDNTDDQYQGSTGVITGFTNPGKTHVNLTVRRSLFTNNTYVNQQDSYAIQVDDTITLQSNCFINNRFVKFGPVQVLNKAKLTSSGNYGSNNGKVTCKYADVTDSSFTTTKCVPYEAKSCTAFPKPVAPTRKPTRKPVAPTRKPVAPARKPIVPTRKPVARL